MKIRYDKSEPLLINVASGKYVLDKFINLDFNRYLRLSRLPSFLLSPILGGNRMQFLKEYKRVRTEAQLFVHNCKKPLPFNADTADHILCSHFIEHVPKPKARKILKNFHSVLKPGGTLHIIVPDLKWRARQYTVNEDLVNAGDKFLESLLIVRENESRFLIRLFEFIGTYGAKHRWMYDEHSLSEVLKSIGYVIEKQNTSPSSQFRKDDIGQVNILARK